MGGHLLHEDDNQTSATPTGSGSRRTKITAAMLIIGALTAGSAAILVGGPQAGGAELLTLDQTKPDVSRADPRLQAIVAQANRLTGGGSVAFAKHINSLEGIPIVVNKWASWCRPCRAEFPSFQREARRFGGKVAFIGVDSDDNDEDARAFLKSNPVPYPSYSDPRLEIAKLIHAIQYFPATAYYDSDGNLTYLKAGQYRTQALLRADIEAHALRRDPGTAG